MMQHFLDVSQPDPTDSDPVQIQLYDQRTLLLSCHVRYLNPSISFFF